VKVEEIVHRPLEGVDVQMSEARERKAAEEVRCRAIYVDTQGKNSQIRENTERGVHVVLVYWMDAVQLTRFELGALRQYVSDLDDTDAHHDIERYQLIPPELRGNAESKRCVVGHQDKAMEVGRLVKDVEEFYKIWSILKGTLPDVSGGTNSNAERR
jgi:hypothetical protein